MSDEEPILLHEPDLMLAILRAARERPATIDEAKAQLLGNLRTAEEPVPEDMVVLEERLDEARELLAGAAAIVVLEDGRYRLTKRGEELLDRHPSGVDQTVLGDFPEFQRFLAQRSEGAVHEGGPHQTGPYQQLGPWRPEPNPQGPEDDPRLDAYLAGQQAFAEGEPTDAKPYATDSNVHLAWENGWCAARDAEQGS